MEILNAEHVTCIQAKTKRSSGASWDSLGPGSRSEQLCV